MSHPFGKAILFIKWFWEEMEKSCPVQPVDLTRCWAHLPSECVSADVVSQEEPEQEAALDAMELQMMGIKP